MTNKRAVEVLYIATCWNGCGRAGIDDLKEAIKMARAALYATEWISVNTPPTEYRDEYGELIPFLVCVKGTQYPFRAMYDGKVWGDGISRIPVTHWMPLPQPPKEDA